MSIAFAPFTAGDTPEAVRASFVCPTCQGTPHMVMLDRPAQEHLATSCCAKCRTTSKYALADSQFTSLWSRQTLPGVYLHFSEAVR